MLVLGIRVGTFGWGTATRFPIPVEQRDSLSHIAWNRAGRATAGIQDVALNISRKTL
jgi:hypothetical protein